jgi:hypothetical protein
LITEHRNCGLCLRQLGRQADYTDLICLQLQIFGADYSLDVNDHQRTILRFTIAGFSFFFLALALYGYLIRVGPTAPDASNRHVCPMYDHGYVFFVTAEQSTGFIALFCVFAILVLIATILSIRWKEFQSPKSYLDLFRNI